ncbi:hypothetical protein Y882_06875 [Dyella japonica DSM 16301]|uniref:Uncharacterized protein n=2 Tax=Dyella japonica TaxID=231455 RepID=A0A0G9HA48_9GAMM|nr:hypothetical protein Y882_06875 [Dyella japonica DSM 16301]
MVNDDFIEALALIPALRHAERRTHERWDFNPPLSMVYAMVGKALADGFEEMTDGQRVYALGVIRHGLALKGWRHALVREALLSTFKARAGGLRKECAAQIHAYLNQLSC